jgi:hypothetical protein
MPRPCHELHALKPRGAGCHWCDLYHTDAGYRALWDGSPPPGPCRHLGPPTGELRECATCAGRVRLKVLACAVYGGTLERMKLEGLGCCAGCPDYAARAEHVN